MNLEKLRIHLKEDQAMHIGMIYVLSDMIF